VSARVWCAYIVGLVYCFNLAWALEWRVETIAFTESLLEVEGSTRLLSESLFLSSQYMVATDSLTHSSTSLAF
jgi:hypothetical protein